MRFSRSFCLLLTEFFLSIRTEISVRSLPLCQILQIFTVNFQRYFRSKDKFGKIFVNTRSLNLHLRESGVLAQARAISGPGRAHQQTISSHLKNNRGSNCEARSKFTGSYKKSVYRPTASSPHTRTIFNVGSHARYNYNHRYAKVEELLGA